MTLDEQIENFETYDQGESGLGHAVRMIAKGELAHSTLEGELVKDLLHAYECLAGRDHFLVQRGLFADFAATVE